MPDLILETFLANQRWQAFRSVETKLTIPPFAPVQFGAPTDPTRAAIDDQTGDFLLLAGQPFNVVYPFFPSEAGLGQAVICDDIAFNGPTEVLPGERGFLTLDNPCVARFTGGITGFLIPATPATGGSGWALINTIPIGGDITVIPSCFKALGLYTSSNQQYATVLRIRYSDYYPTP